MDAIEAPPPHGPGNIPDPPGRDRRFLWLSPKVDRSRNKWNSPGRHAVIYLWLLCWFCFFVHHNSTFLLVLLLCLSVCSIISSLLIGVGQSNSTSSLVSYFEPFQGLSGPSLDMMGQQGETYYGFCCCSPVGHFGRGLCGASPGP